MKNKPKEPFIPAAKLDTIRHEIRLLLEEQQMSARELSAALRISEKEVLEHLVHIRLMVRKEGKRMLTVPACCKKCGFAFRKRERLTKPGKCPVCRGEQIMEPCFFIG